MELIYIENNETDIFFHLALEEYALTHCTRGDYLLLWKSDKAVVAGKHQNVFSEVNLPLAQRLGVPVARRITGGGTVFHDEGNLNFSFLGEHDPQKDSFGVFLAPVIEALRGMGIPVRRQRKSDLAVGGLKISGNAQTVKRGRVLHHGTLLFSSDLSCLGRLLHSEGGSFASKAIPSVRSQVTNINRFLPGCTMEGFRERLLLALTGGRCQTQPFSQGELGEIRQLARDKHRSWEWRFGASPSFVFEKTGSHLGDTLYVKLWVDGAAITRCLAERNGRAWTAAQDALTGLRYDPDTVEEALRKAKLSQDTRSLTERFF